MTTIFGELETILSEDLYPYRYPITIALIVAAALLAAFAYRQRWHLVAWRHRLITGAALVIFLVVAVPLGNYLISPLWERNTVCEASPISGAGSGSEDCEGAAVAATMPPTDAPTRTAPPAADTPAPTATPFTPRAVLEGDFHGADDFHFGEGKALVIETEPGVYSLRFEEFSVRNGPDLFVYVSPNPDGYADEALNLGDLKGTDGAFNYDIPAGTDITLYQSAIVWCRQFGTLFAAATFSPSG
ncbi:MAG: DM13 domain-containing protein [Dehalococcoidia bacterium]